MRDFRTRVGVSLCRLAPAGRGMEIGDWRLGHGWLTYGCLTGRLPGRLPSSGIPPRRHTTDWAIKNHGSWMPNNCVSSSPGWLTLPCAWGGPLAWRPRSPPCRPLSLALHAPHAPHAPQASHFHGSMTCRCPSVGRRLAACRTT
jgi:hypothetical protein